MTVSTMRRLLKLAYTPLVMAVAAGAICTGAGISTAAPTVATTTPAATDTLQSGSAYYWYLVNRTGQPIYGTWSAEMPASGDRSQVEASADHPWPPDGFAKAPSIKMRIWLRIGLVISATTRIGGATGCPGPVLETISMETMLPFLRWKPTRRVHYSCIPMGMVDIRTL
ncbi:hypothetical protein [Rhodococcus jostii]|uniref:hypothetical protein n=1 Tax=Rhodococcus jostii TaxID=132919 RepID=UPI00362CB7EA